VEYGDFRSFFGDFCEFRMNFWQFLTSKLWKSSKNQKFLQFLPINLKFEPQNYLKTSKKSLFLPNFIFPTIQNPNITILLLNPIQPLLYLHPPAPIFQTFTRNFPNTTAQQAAISARVPFLKSRTFNNTIQVQQQSQKTKFQLVGISQPGGLFAFLGSTVAGAFAPTILAIFAWGLFGLSGRRR
jgi:hypothetical protein